MAVSSRKEYDPQKVEKKIQAYWKSHRVFEAKEDTRKTKRYILDMFPYPSGTGLHVGHLLGYFASDVLAIKARMQGYAVLHPMGFDAFGLPAEQYAMDTGAHPATTTKANIASYTKLLKAAGLSFDWERSFATTDPNYYRWTQWIFLQFFDSWYNTKKACAEPIHTLRSLFAEKGSRGVSAACGQAFSFTSTAWKRMTPEEQEDILHHYRLAYLEEKIVNWCPALGTVLANDEVKEGFSERGGHPVERKKMRQWCLRITAYADRLLAGLEKLDWPEHIKEIQRHWIGKSEGVELTFTCKDLKEDIKIFTTRLDTLFGVTFIALAPEHPIVEKIIAWQEENVKHIDQKLSFIPDIDASPVIANLASEHPTVVRLQALAKHVEEAKNRSEKTRLQQANQANGVFTGCYAVHPFGGDIPIWVADYVLTGYGTGAIMGVPAHDERDYHFARKFHLPIVQVIKGTGDCKLPYEKKEGTLMHASFVNGLTVETAHKELFHVLKAKKQAKAMVHYRIHDAVFGRQRYWGEPCPIYYRNNRPYGLTEKELPLKLPPIDVYKPSETGAPPLARAKNWQNAQGYPLEKCTMPAWAGSSWYFLRYMDAHNERALVSRKAADYWGAVDLYVGGKEHATGHLLYARFFMQFLYDRGWLPMQEPFHKLFNQGMIQSYSCFAYRIKGSNQFVSHGLRHQYDTTPFRVDIKFVKKNVLNLKAFKAWRPDLAHATFILEKGKYICGRVLEKMSKSKHNTIDPYPIIDRYGADALRLYLLFLGPIQYDKPWNMEGFQGMPRFMKKLWTFFHAKGTKIYSETTLPTLEASRALHQAIKRVHDGIQRFAFNTSISALMILVHRLQVLGCHSRTVLEDLVRLLAPFAPHLAEYLWQGLGHATSVMYAGFPSYDPAFLVEESVEYPIAINGKVRTKMTCSTQATSKEVKEKALTLAAIAKRLTNKKVKKIVFIPQKMVNIVI